MAPADICTEGGQIDGLRSDTEMNSAREINAKAAYFLPLEFCVQSGERNVLVLHVCFFFVILHTLLGISSDIDCGFS